MGDEDIKNQRPGLRVPCELARNEKYRNESVAEQNNTGTVNQ